MMLVMMEVRNHNRIRSRSHWWCRSDGSIPRLKVRNSQPRECTLWREERRASAIESSIQTRDVP